MRSMVRAGALVLAAVLAGCGSLLHDATHPVFLGAENAQAWIDNDDGAVIAARYSGVKVGRAHCPALLNLTGARTAQCTIPVAGEQLRIEVAHDRTYELHDLDAVVVKPDAERRVADELALRHGIPFRVRCEGPDVRVIPVREQFVCAIDAPVEVYADRIKVEAQSDGEFLPDPLPGAGSHVERMLGREAVERTTGGLSLAGTLVERYLRTVAGGDRHGELARRGLIGAAHCPPRVTLEGMQHVTCTVRAGDDVLRYDLRFDEGRGLVIDHPTVLVVPEVREIAQRYITIREKRAGTPARLVVECGTHTVVTVEPGGSLPCTARWKTTVYPFEARVLDNSGAFTFRNRGAVDE